jgi:isocitrate dehydrogenase kinase/phosphatase
VPSRRLLTHFDAEAINRQDDIMNETQNAARLILEGFEKYFEQFREMTCPAKNLFEQADWAAIQQLSQKRLDLYKNSVIETVAQLDKYCTLGLNQPDNWPVLKQAFQVELTGTDSSELAETFFNSVNCYVFQHSQIEQDNLFLFTESTPSSVTDDSFLVRYDFGSSVVELVSIILSQPGFTIPYENRGRDITNIVKLVKEKVFPLITQRSGNISVEVLKPLFYRNKGAYLVGRIVHATGHIPFVLPFLNSESGTIFVDTVIFDPDDVSIIFSFTRSYFLVDAPTPSSIVNFLQTLLPHKGLAELYNSIGHNKHGKTEFYRSFLEHLGNSDDKFVLAPGIKGMVMSVFTLPSFDIVFKIIKDRFDPPKEMSRETVREKYRLISRHDRVGRMADTQEYSNFHLPLARISDELLQELQAVAPSVITITGDELIISHLYTERKMTPLNLYLTDASEQQIEEAMDEYGNAIKQIASANIFPGDMLLKNFGVTRHGRVIFYDYDEICFLEECHFRKIPEPRTEEQAMSSQPWYSVGPYDIFPEEFRLFFTGNPTARKYFEKYHQDLYEVAYWQGLQDKIKAGTVEDMFPYRRKKRFRRPDYDEIM